MGRLGISQAACADVIVVNFRVIPHCLASARQGSNAASNCTSKTMHTSSAQPLRRVLAPARAPPGSRRSLRLPARGVQTKTAAVLGQERERSPPRRREGPAASENGLKILVFLAEQSQARHTPPWTTEAATLDALVTSTHISRHAQIHRQDLCASPGGSTLVPAWIGEFSSLHVETNTKHSRPPPRLRRVVLSSTHGNRPLLQLLIKFQ